MGAARKLGPKLSGAALGKALDLLRETERKQAEAEERAAPVVRAWVDAQAEDDRANAAWWAMRATWPGRTRLGVRRRNEKLDALAAIRKAAGEALNAATPKALAALQEVESLRVKVANLRAAINAGGD